MLATDDPDVFTFQLDLYHSAENKLFKFTINKDDWDKVYYLVPDAVETDQSYAYLKVGTSNMFKCSEITGDLRDHFWGIKEGDNGKYKISVNLSTLTLDVELITKY